MSTIQEQINQVKEQANSAASENSTVISMLTDIQSKVVSIDAQVTSEVIALREEADGLRVVLDTANQVITGEIGIETYLAVEEQAGDLGVAKLASKAGLIVGGDIGGGGISKL